jgi:hypothetical protein
MKKKAKSNNFAKAKRLAAKAKPKKKKLSAYC